MLTVIKADTREVVRVLGKASDHVPPVWVDERTLLYVTAEGKVMTYDVMGGRREDIGFDGLIPQMKLPGRGDVLCGDKKGRSVTLLHVKERKARQLVTSNFLSVGNSFVLMQNGKGFLYERQTWGNVLLLSETPSIFLHGWSGQETKIFEKGILAGGFPLRGN